MARVEYCKTTNLTPEFIDSQPLSALCTAAINVGVYSSAQAAKVRPHPSLSLAAVCSAALAGVCNHSVVARGREDQDIFDQDILAPDVVCLAGQARAAETRSRLHMFVRYG